MRSVLLLFACVILSGCGTVTKSGGEAGDRFADQKIIADAYLFDARVYREGKPTSVRLECYSTDSLVGLFGRGYLGKGALKGVLTGDSLTVYFPSTDEYVRESVFGLLDAADVCTSANGEVEFTNIFNTLPDTVLAGTNLEVLKVGDENELKYRIELTDCAWLLVLEYRTDEGVPYLSYLEVDDGGNNRLVAKRRTLKRRAEVPLGRFIVDITATAVRIIP